MWEFIKRELGYLHSTFRDSETILWARCQVILGAAWFGLSQADLAPILNNPKYLSFWMIFNGAVSEMLRRSREDWGDAKDGDKK
jgi:hypothetical protein